MGTDRRTWGRYRSAKEQAEVLWAQGRSADEIEQALANEVEARKESGGARPDETSPVIRSIRRWITEWQVSDTSGRWRLGMLESEDDRAVVAILASALAALVAPDLRDLPTVDTARWIARIARAVPTMPPVMVLRCARFYELRRRADRNTLDWEIGFALRPWEGPKAFAQWRRILRQVDVEATQAALVVFSVFERPATQPGGKDE